MDLTVAELGKEYEIQKVVTEDEELNAFLFSLGCYSGEKITVISRRFGGLVVAIKEARYNIDKNLARAILV
ncbi:MAG: ferrous iron transport protein A [Clostridia bacterium]|nr:ferrous iron transport protein A [Clostridia bacterium]